MNNVTGYTKHFFNFSSSKVLGSSDSCLMQKRRLLYILTPYGPHRIMLSTSRLESREKRFAVLMVWALFTFVCLLLLF